MVDVVKLVAGGCRPACWLYFLVVLWAGTGCKNHDAAPEEAIAFVAPAHFPPVTYDLSKNPVTPAGFELGRALFYDPILSSDGTVSCASCHQQTSGFIQSGHNLSHGITNGVTLRNAQPVMNLAWRKNFFWDGGVTDLDFFAPNPIQSPVEMGSHSLADVYAKLRKKPGYRALFAAAFGDTAINTPRFLKALSQFQLMCISADSKYDKVLLNTPGYAFSPEELAGKQLFEAKCARCHSGVLFTDEQYHSNGLPIGNAGDSGRARITNLATDKYRFKTPSLRNVMNTTPYMHDGRFTTLAQVMEHYNARVADAPYVDAELRASRGIALTDEDKANLVSFLKTLSDPTFITNSRLAAPSQLP